MSDEESGSRANPEVRGLRPARPISDEKPSYAPRLPWKWIALGAASVLLLGSFYVLRERSRAEALREDVLRAYDGQVKPAARFVRHFRSKIARLVREAAANRPETFADPRLKIAALHKAQGVYLRIRKDQASSEERVVRAARSMTPDAIARCLGVAPISLRGLYEKGDFLEPEWIDRARKTNDVMTLRVIDDELARRAERDLPVLLNMLRSDYFLLAIEQGPDRRNHPVDVYLWDLRRDRLLLRVRTEPAGTLIPVRIGVKGAPALPRVQARMREAGANDCSIAAQVKAVSGEPVLSFGSDAFGDGTQRP